uniref:Uncharacterized protein n=1 Tax=Arundo donax TaxID=35708 RepID=A0A0A9G890_ARUDO
MALLQCLSFLGKMWQNDQYKGDSVQQDLKPLVRIIRVLLTTSRSVVFRALHDPLPAQCTVVALASHAQ